MKQNLLKNFLESPQSDSYSLDYYMFSENRKDLILFINEHVYTFTDIEISSNQMFYPDIFLKNRFCNMNENSFYNKTNLERILNWKVILDDLVFEKNQILTDLSPIGYYIEFAEFIGDGLYGNAEEKYEGTRIKTNSLSIECLEKEIKIYDELKYLSHMLMNISEQQFNENFSAFCKTGLFMSFDEFEISASSLKFSFENYPIVKSMSFDKLKMSEYWHFAVICKSKNFKHYFYPYKILSNMTMKLYAKPYNYIDLRKTFLENFKSSNKKGEMDLINIDDYRIKCTDEELYIN